MKRRSIVIPIAVLFLVSGLFAANAYSYGGGQSSCKWNKAKGGHKMEEKFFHKTAFILGNSREIGLSDEQIEKVIALKINTKKVLIKTGAEIEILGLDMMTKMRKDKIDLGAVNKLIDQKYEVKKAKAKALIASYVSLKKIITDEQMKKMKELYKKQ